MKRKFSKATAQNQRQKGVTLPLMVFSIVVVLAMAALAIDIATLYLARSEAQRAADAAALAAAKAFIVAGVTSDPGGPSSQTVAVVLAQQQVNAVLLQNNVAGRPAQLVGSVTPNPSFNFGTPGTTNQGNPSVTVVVGQTGLPTFFSRIWSHAPNSVSATATAEAYNPSGTSAVPPVSSQCVKPFIIPNQDPGTPTLAQYIDPATGAIVNPGRVSPSTPQGVVGETITFNADCPLVGGPPGKCNNKNPPKASISGPGLNGCGRDRTIYASCLLDFVPATLPPPASSSSCPSCGGGGTQFENDIACCNTTAMACNSATQVALGGTAASANMTLDPTGPSGPFSNGLQCLIHQAPGNGEDALDQTGFPTVQGNPFRFTARNNNPLTRGPNRVVNVGDLVTTSDSIITLLIYDSSATPLPPAGTVNIIGYMQVFVEGENNPQHNSFDGVVLNVAGCGTSAGTGAPISGGGVSAVPVRLIHN